MASTRLLGKLTHDLWSAMQIRVERKPAKKGYMRLHTSLGDLNLELHCNVVPRACENFLILAESGYYSNTVFHRSIKNFMIQVRLLTECSLESLTTPCTRLSDFCSAWRESKEASLHWMP